MTNAPPPTERPVDAAPDRRAAVDRAREGWIRRLIDLSRRNNLLYYRDLKAGMLDLSGADPDALRALLAGTAVTLARLLPGTDEVRAAARAQEIRRQAIANLEERGLETLFVTLGMATWTPAGEGQPPEAPVLLVPVAVEVRGRDGRVVALRRTGEVQVNLVLLHVLEVGHGCPVAAEALLAAGEPAGDGPGADAAFDPQAVLARLTEEAAEVRGFGVKARAVLGNFSFQKMAMVKDLRERGAELGAHDLIAAIAGDATGREAVLGAREPIDPGTRWGRACRRSAAAPGRPGRDWEPDGGHPPTAHCESRATPRRPLPPPHPGLQSERACRPAALDPV